MVVASKVIRCVTHDIVRKIGRQVGGTDRHARATRMQVVPDSRVASGTGIGIVRVIQDWAEGVAERASH